MTHRKAKVEDAHNLATFAAAAFWDTYRDIDDPSDIADYVAEHFRPKLIASVISDPASTTLLAEAPELAGYAVLKRSEAPTCITGSEPLELARFYVGKAFIGQGFGTKLLLAAHAEAKRLSAQTLWLAVDDRNQRAIQFYERFGFVQVGGREFPFGDRVYIDPIYAAPVRDDA